MKKILNKLLGSLLLFFCVSASTCRKEDPVILKPEYDPPVQVTLLWKKYLFDASGAYSINPILNSQMNILMSARYNSAGESEIMKLYDGKTGEVKWEWKDYFRHEEHFVNTSHTLSGDILILSAYNATYALNIVTGQTVWRHFMDTMYGSHMVFAHNGYVYKGFQGESGRYQCYIFRTPVNSVNWELVCTYTDSTHQFDRMNVTAIRFGKNKNGDELMVCPLMCGGKSPPFALAFCYNLTQKKFQWIKSNPDKYTSYKNQGTIVIGKNIVLYAGMGAQFYITGLNLEDGSFVWHKELVSDGVELFEYKGKVISTVNGRSPVACYDPSTGNRIWEQRFSANELSKMNFAHGYSNVFKNYLFSTHCDNLVILDLDNGSVVFNKRAADGDGCLQYGVAINEHDRTFYVQDRIYVCCYRLPSEVKY